MREEMPTLLLKPEARLPASKRPSPHAAVLLDLQRDKGENSFKQPPVQTSGHRVALSPQFLLLCFLSMWR